MKERARRTLVRAMRSRPAKRALAAAVAEDPEIAVAPLRQFTVERNEFADVAEWPPSVTGFEDLAFLFTSSELNFGIALLGLDEAACLFRLARELPDDSTLVEIGRMRGGSTLLLAAATRGRSDLISIDVHDVLFFEGREQELDAQLRAALSRYGLAERVRLVVADSATADRPASPVDLVLVDGDHSYEGARRDYLHWRGTLRRGGHLLFHDGADSRRFATPFPGVVRLVQEIEATDPEFARRGTAGSLVHFERVAGGMEKP